MTRLITLVLILAPLAALAQPAAPLSTDTPPPPEPAIDLAYPAQERATAAPVENDLAQRVIEQVNKELDKPAETPGPPLAALQDQPGQYSPLQNSMKALFGLASALAVLLLLYYVVKRFGKNSPLFAGADLARVMGKVYLSPRASLHFVRTGGRILVLGVTPNAISTVAEFDAETFEPTTAGLAAASPPAASPETEAFLTQFKASLESIARATPSESAEQDDTEIAALREDVQRLQKYLQDTVKGGDNV